MNEQLRDREFIAGDYSIADMACYPWIVPHQLHGQNLDHFPRLKRWFRTIAARPATIKVYGEDQDWFAARTASSVSDEARKAVFGRTAR